MISKMHQRNQIIHPSICSWNGTILNMTIPQQFCMQQIMVNSHIINSHAYTIIILCIANTFECHEWFSCADVINTSITIMNLHEIVWIYQQISQKRWKMMEVNMFPYYHWRYQQIVQKHVVPRIQKSSL